MSYVFQGRLCGSICGDCSEVLSNVKVRLYRARKDQNVTALAVAQAKETFAILTNDQLQSKQSSLIAEAETDGDGKFVFDLGEKQKYNGEAFEVDVYCGTVPHRKPTPKAPNPLQFSITVLQPAWRQIEKGFVAVWEYCIPNRYWCFVRARFGAWTICGEVTLCQDKTPIGGVKVRAFDVDWLQDDEIGSALTDGAGRFRIDYLTQDFEKTPFSPTINIEWIAGPDLYFKVETPGGIPLLSESRSRGRDPDRENVGHCFCVGLCLEKQPPVSHTIPLFTHVGMYRVDPIYGDFTADGLTAAGNYAFTDTIPLRGLLPNGNDPDAIEYHFVEGEYDAAGVVLGSTTAVDATMIRPTVIGQLEYFDWNTMLSAWILRSANYWVNSPGAPPTTIHRPITFGGDLTLILNQPVKAGGWIEVPRHNDLTPGGTGLFVGGFVDMVSLDTTRLTYESYDLTAPLPELKAGEAVPAAKKSRMHRFKLFFEARIAVSPPGPVLSANALDKIVLSNTSYTQHRHPNWAGYVTTTRAAVMIDIDELSAPGSGCNRISDHVHALWTAYHPFLGSVAVSFEGNTPPPLPASISPAIMGGESVSPSGGHDFNVSAQPNCAYILWLTVTLNLTYGYGAFLPPFQDHVAFCKG
jgi:hypothetical protein